MHDAGIVTQCPGLYFVGLHFQYAMTSATLVGIGRLSRNALVRALCSSYVELTRNVPLLLQLFIWYFLLTELLPPIDDVLQPLPGLFLSKNGLQVPLPHWDAGVPAYSYLLGMHAFGLEECNQYAEAESAGRRALAMSFRRPSPT